MTAQRSSTNPHEWRDGACRHCGMRSTWAGARKPCEAIYALHRARSEAKHRAVANALRILGRTG